MKAKTTKKALFASIFSTLLCGAMLAGSTFAWFTDRETSGANKIVAGNLDIELYVQNDEGEFVDATEVDSVFGVDLWEPGVVAYETFKAVNVGNLALKYNMYLDVLGKNTVGGKSLADVIKIAVVDEDTLAAAETREDLIEAVEWKAITDGTAYVTDEALLPEEEGDAFTVVAYWEPTDHDNDYNLNNGKKADDGSDALYINFGVTLAATQYTYESDSFGDQYDANAQYGIRAVTDAIAQGAKDSNEALAETTNGLVYFDEALTDEDGVLAITLHFDFGSKGYVLDAFEAISALIVTAVNDQAANIKSIEIGAGLPEKLAEMGIDGVETNVRELNGKPVEYEGEYESWLFEDLATLMKAAGLGGSSLRDAMEACLEFAATEGLDVAITAMDGNTQVYRMYFALNWTESASVKTAVNQGAKDANAILANATNGLIYFDNALQQSGDELVITLHFEEGSFEYVDITYAAVKALIGEAVYANAANIEYIQIVNQAPRYPADFDPAGDWVEADLRAVMSGISGGLSGALQAAKAEGLAVTIKTNDGVEQVYRMNFDISENW